MFFFTDFMEKGTKHFPIDQRVEFGQKVVELVDFIESVFEVEETVLTVSHGKKREGKGKYAAYLINCDAKNKNTPKITSL